MANILSSSSNKHLEGKQPEFKQTALIEQNTRVYASHAWHLADSIFQSHHEETDNEFLRGLLR